MEDGNKRGDGEAGEKNNNQCAHHLMASGEFLLTHILYDKQSK